jgi:hypothetical protein
LQFGRLPSRASPSQQEASPPFVPFYEQSEIRLGSRGPAPRNSWTQFNRRLPPSANSRHPRNRAGVHSVLLPSCATTVWSCTPTRMNTVIITGVSLHCGKDLWFRQSKERMKSGN